MAVKFVNGGKKKLKKSFKGDLDLELPDKKSEPSDTLQDYSMLVFGKKKIGKTTLAAQFPDALFLMCEPGGRALSIRQVQVRNWREFKGYVELAVKDKRTGTIVVDTADWAYEYCMDHVCQEKAIEHPSDEGYGKGWKAVRKEFSDVVGTLLHSEKGVVFISHSRDEEFKTRREETFNKVVSSMPGQAKDILEGLVDIWANYDYDKGKRVLTIGGSDEIDAGHRIEGRFQYKDGTPVSTIPMGKSPKEGFDNFCMAFLNRLPIPGEKKAKKRLVL